MSEKRRDRKKRILRFGESQNADGRYRYTYTDISGKRKDIYSWRLDVTDPYPEDKRPDLSLREKEKKVERDLFDHIISDGGNYTVLSLVERYLSLKTGVRDSTRAGYHTVLSLLRKDPFGNQRIDKVKLSDAKLWLIKLQREDGKGYSTIHTIRGVLRPAFQMAEDDDLIRKNPFRFELSTIIENDSEPREALTEKQMEEYLDYVRNDEHYCKYYDMLYIMHHADVGVTLNTYTHIKFEDAEREMKRVTGIKTA